MSMCTVSISRRCNRVAHFGVQLRGPASIQQRQQALPALLFLRAVGVCAAAGRHLHECSSSMLSGAQAALPVTHAVGVIARCTAKKCLQSEAQIGLKQSCAMPVDAPRLASSRVAPCLSTPPDWLQADSLHACQCPDWASSCVTANLA